MISKIVHFQFNTFIVLVLAIIACKNATSDIQDKKNEFYNIPKKSIDSLTTIIGDGKYKLTLNTKFSSDTLDEVDYKEDKYSSPIILIQHLSFFYNDIVVKIYKIPIKYVVKQTIKKKSLQVSQTPIYKMCLLKTPKSIAYYFIHGTDYCNGSKCPEFIGIYSMVGKIIFESFSNRKQNVSLKETISKYEIEFKHPDHCVEIDLFK